MKVCLVTDRKICGEEKLLKIISEAVDAGLDMIQVREKDLLGKSLLELSEKVVHICKGTGCRVFINKRFDIALVSGADGIHLGHDAMPPEVVKEKIGNQLDLGLSLHSIEEASLVHKRKAEVAFLGPVFHSSSKPMVKPLGVEKLEEAARHCQIPLFGIGGINETNIKLLEGRGVAGVAMISGMIKAPSIKDLITLAREIS